MIIQVLLFVLSGLFAQDIDVIPSPERLEQVLNDSVVESKQQPVLEQNTDDQIISKAKKIKDKKIKKTKKIKKIKKGRITQ
ncbi:MAG: hypothetical protein WCQ47_02860 [bacterium]